MKKSDALGSREMRLIKLRSQNETSNPTKSSTDYMFSL